MTVNTLCNSLKLLRGGDRIEIEVNVNDAVRLVIRPTELYSGGNDVVRIRCVEKMDTRPNLGRAIAEIAQAQGWDHEDTVNVLAGELNAVLTTNQVVALLGRLDRE